MLVLDRHRPSPGVPEFNRRFRWLVGIVAGRGAGPVRRPGGHELPGID
jgi:hypothetical protein